MLVAGGASAIDTLRSSWAFIADEIGPDVVRLRRVRADAAVAPLLAELDAWISQRVEAPYIDLSGAKDFASFEERYTPKARRNRRRLLRRLEEKGKVAFVHSAGGAEARALALKAIELKRLWLSDRGLFSPAVRDDRFRDFFADATESAPSPCRVSAITVDGAPAAIMVFIRFRKAPRRPRLRLRPRPPEGWRRRAPARGLPPLGRRQPL
ncbi:MAG: GNAT family N-acetyltransferase [Hyphomicrobium sp.]